MFRFPLLVLCLVLVGSPVWGATLESPAQGATLSGLGFISGWKCDAGAITVRINNGGPIPVAGNQPRADTRIACGTIHTGFIMQINWALLGDGEQTVVASDDGVKFASSVFTVVTAGEPYLPDAAGQCVVPDFPAPGENASFAWNTSTQHLELTDAGSHIPPPDSGTAGLAHGAQSVTLHFAYRSAQTVEIEREATVHLALELVTGSGATADIMTDDIRELTLGDMAVEVQVYPHGMILRVGDDATGRPLTTFNYHPAGNVQNRCGGSGFTGLHYIYHPRSDAELQFWATACDDR